MEEKNSTIGELLDFMKSRGGTPRMWYVGITKDINHRLYVEHNVEMNSTDNISKRVESVEIAREIENFFLENVGVDGAPGGSDEEAVWVYLYQKAANTNP